MCRSTCVKYEIKKMHVCVFTQQKIKQHLHGVIRSIFITTGKFLVFFSLHTCTAVSQVLTLDFFFLTADGKAATLRSARVTSCSLSEEGGGY